MAWSRSALTTAGPQFRGLGHNPPGSQTPDGNRPGVSPTGPLVEYKYYPVCDGDCSDAAQQRVFDAAGCTGNQSAVWVSARTVGSQGSYVLQGPPECLTQAQQLAFDPAQLQATIDQYFQRIPLPAPKLRVAPADNAVVNLPEIVSADTPAQTTFTVDIAAVPDRHDQRERELGVGFRRRRDARDVEPRTPL